MKKQNEMTIKTGSDASDGLDIQTNIKKPFRKLRLWLSGGLIICFTLPLMVLSAYFHFQFNSTLKNSERLSLAALSESQRNTIDLFLQERVVNLFSLFHYTELKIKPTKQDMELYLQDLRRSSDSFVDVGFLNSEGLQIGYAGPFPYLLGKDYSEENWLKLLIKQGKNYFISDIYLGFRNKPHFTIATKQLIDGKYYIMRSTLDPDKFYVFLRTISHGKNVDSSLINEKGIYQILDPNKGKLLSTSDYVPHTSTESGFQEVVKESDSYLIAYSWLTETKWALLVRQPASVAHVQMLQARKVLIVSSITFLVIATIIIVYTVNKILGKAEVETKQRQVMHLQLIHASKLASVGEIATGIAHEINNPLAIITSSSGVIKDMLDPEFKLDSSPEKILEELANVDAAAFRARGITKQLLNLGRKNEPKAVLCNLNDIIDEVISGVVKQELIVDDIELNLNFAADLPEIPLDHDQVRQVFLNLINNAHDAIAGPGRITITTKTERDKIIAEIKDTGKGMTTDQVKQVFNPFYTTKEVGQGTGLGLSVSLNIVESMGGSIDVQSLKGSGSIFTVVFPLDNSLGAANVEQ
jgi:two-component system NtrC family sensor kinase